MTEISGWIGAVSLILAYFFLTNKRFHRESIIYHSANLLGAVLVGINSTINQAYPSAFLNTVWGVIAVYGLLTSLAKYIDSRSNHSTFRTRLQQERSNANT